SSPGLPPSLPPSFYFGGQKKLQWSNQNAEKKSVIMLWLSGFDRYLPKITDYYQFFPANISQQFHKFI
ncbi:MAG TPA: hypothetical protein PK816_05710, partial [Candidatus Cloacimonadota bacterium]|nr:hypothetical protein [Candidatus Cloacimonadota bacterium]